MVIMIYLYDGLEDGQRRWIENDEFYAINSTLARNNIKSRKTFLCSKYSQGYLSSWSKKEIHKAKLLKFTTATRRA